MHFISHYIYMTLCREYARSLINNLSLLSGKVLVPTEPELHRICIHLANLQAKGCTLDEQQLIHGSKKLNSLQDFKLLKQLITKIKIKKCK